VARSGAELRNATELIGLRRCRACRSATPQPGRASASLRWGPSLSKRVRMSAQVGFAHPSWRNGMKIGLVLCLCLGSCSYAFAQSSSGSSAGSSTGASGTAGSTLSNSSMISGTGGSPGPNTSNALNHRTTGNNLGAPSNSNPAAASHSNAVNTPAANSATQNLGSTKTGILKK
jgi:hypothetical protein